LPGRRRCGRNHSQFNATRALRKPVSKALPDRTSTALTDSAQSARPRRDTFCQQADDSTPQEPATMRRPPLYSASPKTAARQPPVRAGLPLAGDAEPAFAAAAGAGNPPSGPGRLAAITALIRRHERKAWSMLALLLAALAGAPGWLRTPPRPLTIEQIDAAIRDSITRTPLSSAAADAYEAVLPSVVRIDGEQAGEAGARPGKSTETGHSVGTGVVIVDRGLILTALHVVDGASHLRVSFADGTESDAFVVSRQPENDLAVLQARTLPDDLQAATMESSAGLAPGDEVIAVGFPFGIGPSVSAGVVSGLDREFRSPGGGRVINHLIQFDAAANPGNSGGPLVTLSGHVVGIITAIMNPSAQRTFIGIGFAVPIDSAATAAGMPPF
jgi:S1-C subfamily serine protease